MEEGLTGKVHLAPQVDSCVLDHRIEKPDEVEQHDQDTDAREDDGCIAADPSQHHPRSQQQGGQ